VFPSLRNSAWKRRVSNPQQSNGKTQAPIPPRSHKCSKECTGAAGVECVAVGDGSLGGILGVMASVYAPVYFEAFNDEPYAHHWFQKQLPAPAPLDTTKPGTWHSGLFPRAEGVWPGPSSWR
jgi:hypothetical protein